MPSPMSSPELIAGRYRIISQLGEGGMGVAYRAWDNEQDVPVVVKMPKADRASDSDFIERFNREIKALAGLAHPHIVPIVGNGQDEDGRPYVAMRFLPGGSLSDRRRRGPDKKPLPGHPSLLHHWLPAIAEALDFVHRSGVIHRDVKPDNIFFDARWNAFLGDFGVAKVVEAGGAVEKDATMTKTGIAIGTYAYMAPEVWSNKPVVASDQYSLAVIVYEMLAGMRPFTGEFGELARGHIIEPPPPLMEKQPQLPSRLCEAVHQALSKKPEDRFETCGEFAAALLKGVPVPSVKDGVTRVMCPACHAMLDLDEKVAGKSGKCRKCSAPVTVSTDLEAVWLARENPGKPGRTNEAPSETPAMFHAPRPPGAHKAYENTMYDGPELFLRDNAASTSTSSSAFIGSTARNLLERHASVRPSAITPVTPPPRALPFTIERWWEPPWMDTLLSSAWFPVLFLYWCITRLLGVGLLIFAALAIAVLLIDGCVRIEDRMRKDITRPVVRDVQALPDSPVEPVQRDYGGQAEDKKIPLGTGNLSRSGPAEAGTLLRKEEEARILQKRQAEEFLSMQKRQKEEVARREEERQQKREEALVPESAEDARTERVTNRRSQARTWAGASALDELLAAAFEALRRNDFDTAESFLTNASKEADNAAAVSRLQSWRHLASYYKGFVGYCGQALAGVRQGDEYVVAKTKVVILGVDDKVLRYRVIIGDSSQNKTVPRDKIPGGIMFAIVSYWFDENPANDLYLGAYHLVAPNPPAERARVNEHWQKAQGGDADASLLIPLLRDPVITNSDGE